jgi:glycosyltransferase involved in cell wall biosynthesis
MRETLLRYIDDPELRRTHGGAARERVISQFSLDAMVQRYLDFYDGLLSSDSLSRGAEDGKTQGSVRAS